MNLNPKYYDAVLSLVGGVMSGPTDGPISRMNFDENEIAGIKDGHTLPSESEIQTELTRLQAEFDAQAYARNRATAFPSIGDQLDMQYHDLVDGTTTWKDAVTKVKSDNPKPE